MNRILVRTPNWIGDQVIAFPFFYYLRQRFPKAEIVASCVDWVSAVQYRGLVDRVEVLPRATDTTLRAKFSALEEGARKLRELGPWDLAITLPNSFSSAWVQWRAGARQRRGYLADSRGWLLTQRLDLKVRREEHRSEAYCQLLPEGMSGVRARDFWGFPPDNDLDPGTPGVLPYFDAEKHWPQAKAAEAPSFPYWILAPGSTAETRRWPREMYAELARMVTAATGWIGLVIGGPKEAPLGSWLCEESGVKLQDWTGQGGVADYWKVFKHARFTVANDSGLAHVASLLGSSVGVIWGGGNPVHTRPMGPGHVKLVFNGVSCWPCESNECALPEGRKIECLRGISPQRVWEELNGAFGFG